MRYVALLVLLCSIPALAGEPCLVLRHATTNQQLWVNAANWRYVEGDFPNGMKWKSNVTDRYVRKIKEAGGRVVVIPANYTPADLEDARKQCAESHEANK